MFSSIFHSTSGKFTVIRKSHYVNKIRSLNYVFKSKQKRTELYRKKGGTHYIPAPN